MKGADDVMIQKIHSNDYKILIEEKTYEFASIGLRTLCFGNKIIDEADFIIFEN